MKFVFGFLLGFITIMYWAAMLKNIPHMWKLTHSKEWADFYSNRIILYKFRVVLTFILGGVFGLLLFKWSAQLLGIIN